VFPAVLLITDGFQVPEIRFVELVGKLGANEPSQNGGITLKVGIVRGVIFIERVT
jgi:hypothetical protein